VPDNLTNAGSAADAEGAPASAASVSASVIVLVQDAALLDMLGQAVEGRRRVWRAENMVHAADLLVAAPYAVLLLDASVTGKRTAEFVERLTGQFTDLPIIVAGRLDDEVGLGQLISNGIVFRFLHKPVSVERARNFIEAAVGSRSHGPAAIGTQARVQTATNRVIAPTHPSHAGWRRGAARAQPRRLGH